MECVGECGAKDFIPQWAAILWRNGAWYAEPICNPCYFDPGHRKVVVKAHFFPWREREQARRAAGSSSGIGGPLR